MKPIFLTIIYVLLSPLSAIAGRYVAISPNPDYLVYETKNHVEASCIINTDSIQWTRDLSQADTTVKFVKDIDDADVVLFVSNGPTDLRRCLFLKGDDSYLDDNFDEALLEEFKVKAPSRGDKDYIEKSFQETLQYDSSADQNSEGFEGALDELVERAKISSNATCRELGQPYEYEFSHPEKVSVRNNRESVEGVNKLSINYSYFCATEKSDLSVNDQGFKTTKTVKDGWLSKKKVVDCEIDVNVSDTNIWISNNHTSKEGFNIVEFKKKIVEVNQECLSKHCTFSLDESALSDLFLHEAPYSYNSIEGKIKDGEIHLTGIYGKYYSTHYSGIGLAASLLLGEGGGSRSYHDLTCQRTLSDH